MDTASIVVAVTRWINREFSSKLMPLSPEQIGVFTLSALAERNPEAALALLASMPGYGQLVAPLAGAAGRYFDDIAATLVQTLRDNGGVRVILGGRPYIVSGDDMERIVSEIRKEDAKRKAEAKRRAEESAAAQGA